MKTLEDLRDTPFEVLLNGDIFPCRAGAIYHPKIDIYQLRTTNGFKIYTMFNQIFISKKEQFVSADDLRPGDQVLASNHKNHTFKGIKPVKEPDFGKIYPEYEFYDYGFHIEYFHKLFNICGRMNLVI